MKKGIFALTIIIATLALYVFNLSTHKYASKQAKNICQWLNSQSKDINFRVGPLAFEHLQKMHKLGSQYTCSISKYEHVFGYSNEVSVLISNNSDSIYLIYGSGSAKHLFLPRYYQHASNNKQSHHG